MHSFEPKLVVERDLGKHVEPIEGRRGDHRYRQALCLVRLHGVPLGLVPLDLGAGEGAPEEIRRAALRVLEDRLLAQDGSRDVAPGSALLPGTTNGGTPLVSVIVPTRDRVAPLVRCLRHLTSQDYPDYEIIVVDNASRSAATRELVARRSKVFPRLRYLREDRPGQSWARNSGLAETSSSLVAFVDDDILVDRHWLSALVAAFRAAPDVACVTGLILPAELETAPQALLEEYGGFNKGFERRVFDLEENRPPDVLYPYAAGQFGSGASMAFRADALKEVGGFSLALGTGSPPSGGEDITAFRKVILAGHRLVYEPAAIAYHPHPRSDRDLTRQLFRYGRGLGAYITACFVEDPSLLLSLTRRAPVACSYLLRGGSPRNRQRSNEYPRRLVAAELAGLLLGPYTYVRGRVAASELIKETRAA
jgi:GT2 family glycosyltransferase